MKIMVSGGAGFIGSALCRYFIKETDFHIINVDKLTYAANLQSLQSIEHNSRYHFEKLDICQQARMADLINHYQPDAIIHLAAESHVDRSIDSAADFIQTNIVGTYAILEAARSYWSGLSSSHKENFRFLQVSTDEVFGSLGRDGSFNETTAYDPSSPYSASKAAGDHLAMAWHRTYSLPIMVTNCSNNYGPYQFPEKLIPLMFINALQGKSLPVYGNGSNIRDWLFVDDHARALHAVLIKGTPGERYNIGSNSEQTNLQVVHAVCNFLDNVKPSVQPHCNLIKMIADRPGHDFRYAINTGKIKKELGWNARESFSSGLEKTLHWYLTNQAWWKPLLDRPLP